jgi:serine kinase of HPr protein (carbohydrate metabolism regulator)
LLAGESGAGKSSLAYACAMRGWTYISDDASSLVRNSRQRTVLGKPNQFRFRPSAQTLFPEFAGWTESRRARGKPTIEVATELLQTIRTASSATVHSIVFLNRKHAGRSAELIPLSRETAVERLSTSVWPPELAAIHDRQSSVENLVQNSNFELRYRTLDEAIDLLDTLVESPETQQ